MKLFDTHAHLDDPQLMDHLNVVLSRAMDAGVEKVVAIGTTADSSDICVELSRDYPNQLKAAVGIQPNYCAEAKSADWDRVVELSHLPEVVAIGETGLDRYWDHTPFEVQQDYFDRHIRLSQSVAKPFVVHMRDCMDDILIMLQEAVRRGALSGVMHSYTGDADSAKQCIELGLHISFAGMVTFKKSDELRRIAASIPNHRILIETDAPYLSPHPKRSQRPNEPALIQHTAKCLAETRGDLIEEFARLTFQNASELFGM